MSDVTALLNLNPGQAGTVVDCSGGHSLMSRFAAMGFTPGSRITVINNHRRGPLLVLVHGARVALGRGEAARVLVRPEGDGHHGHCDHHHHEADGEHGHHGHCGHHDHGHHEGDGHHG